MSYTTFTSSSRWYQPSWLRSAMIIAFSVILCASLVSCSKPDNLYKDHCNSIVHETSPVDPEFTTIPFSPNQHGYYFGGDDLFNSGNKTRQYYYSSTSRKTLLFRTHHVHSTREDGVMKVEASLILQPSLVNRVFSDVAYSHSYSTQVVPTWSGTGALNFEVKGFWSVSTGKLCMVGSGSTYTDDGKDLPLSAVVKLDDVKTSSNITSLIRGTIESLISVDDLGHFAPIPILMIPQMNYSYSKVLKGSGKGCADKIDVPKSSSLRLPLSKSVCSILMNSVNAFQMEYSSRCNSTKSCSPLGKEVGYFPELMYLSIIQCTNDTSLRFLIEFADDSYMDYYRPFSPNTTLIAEGSWDAKNNHLCAVACRVLSARNNYLVDDCSISLTLRLPAVLSIRNTSLIVGQIWSNKTVNDKSYFNEIKFQSYSSHIVGFPGLKYNYTLVDEARKSCPVKESKGNGKKQYPNGNSYDMQFSMSVKDSRGKKVGHGYSDPMAVGNQIALSADYTSMTTATSTNSLETEASHRIPLNMSYRMSYGSYNKTSTQYSGVQIFAEGTYDAETGTLCMVGCKDKYLGSRNLKSATSSSDCNVLVNVEFPPIDSNKFIKGQISSTREKSDPQYFETLSFTAVPYYSSRARESIWRIDFEIVMNLISKTLECVFVGFQIWYIKKNQTVIPSISFLMLAILTLGQMIPLLLNFEALFMPKENKQTILLSSGGWLEVNEAIVRVVTMVAFLLQCRLFLFAWSARFAYANQKAFWVAEKRALYVSVTIYVAGGLIMKWKNQTFGRGTRYSYQYGNQNVLAEDLDLRSYTDLVLDGFLLPQIMLNIFKNSKEKALSNVFFMGTTLVHLLPHAYGLYKTHFYEEEFNDFYIYADRGADYYSTAWDVIIPPVALLFTATIYVQQRCGGRCLLPKRFREQEAYEKVPVADDA